MYYILLILIYKMGKTYDIKCLVCSKIKNHKLFPYARLHNLIKKHIHYCNDCYPIICNNIKNNILKENFCPNCENVLDINKFSINNRIKTGYNNYCIECIDILKKEDKIIEEKNKTKEYNNNYFANNKELVLNNNKKRYNKKKNIYNQNRRFKYKIRKWTTK